MPDVVTVEPAPASEPAAEPADDSDEALSPSQSGIKDLLIKDMIEDWWKKNEQERMNSKMTSAAESSMSSAD